MDLDSEFLDDFRSLLSERNHSVACETDGKKNRADDLPQFTDEEQRYVDEMEEYRKWDKRQNPSQYPSEYFFSAMAELVLR